MLSQQTLAATSTVVLALVVLRMGISAMISVVALTFLLLCNPTVRVFLDISLPNQISVDSSRDSDRRTIAALQGRIGDLVDVEVHEARMKPLPGRMDLSSLPRKLRPELQHLLRLVRLSLIHI